MRGKHTCMWLEGHTLKKSISPFATADVPMVLIINFSVAISTNSSAKNWNALFCSCPILEMRANYQEFCFWQVLIDEYHFLKLLHIGLKNIWKIKVTKHILNYVKICFRGQFYSFLFACQETELLSQVPLTLISHPQILI